MDVLRGGRRVGWNALDCGIRRMGMAMQSFMIFEERKGRERRKRSITFESLRNDSPIPYLNCLKSFRSNCIIGTR